MNQPTLSAMPEARLMECLERTLPETRERQCPACRDQSVVHAGHIIGGGGEIKSEHRCETCGTAFWFVRERMPLSGALAALATRLEDGGRRDQASPAS